MDTKVLKNKSLKKLIPIVFGILFIFLVKGILTYFVEHPSPLNQIVNTLNQEKFNTIDNYTTFINAELHQKVIQMNFRISDSYISMYGSDIENNLKRSTNVIRDYFIIQIKIGPSIDILKEKNVSFEFHYYDKNYKLLYKMVIKPEDYK